MLEGFFNSSGFTIPIQRSINSPCSWCYPLPCANASHEPRVIQRSPFIGLGERTTDSQCRCLDCQQRLQWRKKCGGGEQGRPSSSRRGNRSNGARREIPIHIVNQARSLQDTHQPEIKMDSTVSACHIGNDVKESHLPGRRYSLEERQNEENAQRQCCVGIHTEKTDKSGTDSLQSADMVIDSVATEGVQDQEVKQTKLDKIGQVSVEARKLAEGIATFDGKEKCKQYLYLEEMLTKCLLRLDEISTDGFPEVRKCRKEVATIVDKELKRLEEKLKGNLELCTVETTKSEDKDMDEINVSPEESASNQVVNRDHKATNDGENKPLVKDENTGGDNCDKKQALLYKTLKTDDKVEEGHLLKDRNELEECNVEPTSSGS